MRVKFNRRGFNPVSSDRTLGSLAKWVHCVVLLILLLSLRSPLLQGSQDSTGGQEGLVAPPFSAFPPPPPPQNGLPGTEFGPGPMFAAGGQGTAEVGAGANGPTAATAGNTNNVSAMCSLILQLVLCVRCLGQEWACPGYFSV